MAGRRRNILFFFLIIAVNIVLRVLFIDHYPLNYDESVSIKNTLLDFGHIKHEAEWDNNPPFYYYCLWIWHKILPLTEANARLLSTLFISLAVAFTFLLLSKKGKSFEGFCTALFLSASPFLMFHSHEARAYALVVFLSVMSAFVLFDYLQKPSAGKIMLLSLLNFLLFYTHYITALYIFSQFLFVIVFYHDQIKRLLLPQILIIPGLIALRFTAKQYQNIFGFNEKKDFWLSPAVFRDLKDAISELYFPPALFITLLILCFAIALSRKGNQKDKDVWYFAFTGLIPIVLLFAVGTQKAVFLPRYLIYSIPFTSAFLILAAMKARIGGKPLALLAACAPLLGFTLKPEKGQDYRMLSEVIRLQKKKNECVVIHTADNLNLFHFYYDPATFTLKNRDSVMRASSIFGIRDTEDLRSVELEKYSKLYLVQTYNKKVMGQDPVQQFLERHFSYRYTTNRFLGTEFSVFKKQSGEHIKASQTLP